MTQRVSVRQLSNLKKFRDEGHFNDCCLISGDAKYYSNRLFLAKYSGYFRKYFIEHPAKLGDVTEVSLPENPENKFGDFLNLLYDQCSTITVKELPCLLKIADFYDFLDMKYMLHEFCFEQSNQHTLLYFVEKFLEFDLQEYAISLAPDISVHIENIIKRSESEEFTIQQIYQASSPKVFAASINSIKDSSITPIQKVELLDNFVAFKKIELTDEEREALASPVVWDLNEDPAAFLHLLKFPCDWLPSHISRPLLKKILDNRLKIVRDFKKEISKSQDASKVVSRWYPFAWAQEISNSIYFEGTPEINAIEFIRTFGGSAKPINPMKYGLVSFFGTEPMTPQFLPENALIDDDQIYYMGRSLGGNDEEKPYFGISFGKSARFKVTNLKFHSSVIRKKLTGEKNKEYSTVKAIEFFSGINEEPCMKSNPIRVPIPDKGDLDKFDIPGKDGSHFAFKMKGESSSGGFIMRINTLDLKGSFILQ